MSTQALFQALKTPVGDPIGKLILIVLADISNEHDECWPSMKYIADRAECSRMSVVRRLETLERDGLIEIKRRFNTKGDRTSNLYRLTLGTIDLSEKQKRKGVVPVRYKGCTCEVQGGGICEIHNTPTLLNSHLHNGKKGSRSTKDRSIEEDLSDTSWAADIVKRINGESDEGSPDDPD